MLSRNTRHGVAFTILSFCLLLIVPAGQSFADEDVVSAFGSIKGRVVDEQGGPVANATIRLGEDRIVVGTDADGRYQMHEVPAGPHRLEASCIGYTGEVVNPVAVAEGETVEVHFQLVALPIPVKEIVVTAKASLLREAPAAAVALDRKQIKELPHFGDDLYRAIRVLPGTSGGDISARFSIRGGLYDETLVKLDGQELMEPFHLKDFESVFSILDPEMIGGLELTPGGFTAEYGDRMSGVLDMATSAPKTTRFGIGISLTTAWVNTAGLFANGKGSWLASARRGYLDFILKAAGDDEDGSDPPDPRYWDAFAKLGYSPNANHNLSLTFLFADDDLLFDEDDEDGFADVQSGYTSSYLWLSHQAVVGTKTFVNSGLYGGNITVDRDFLWIDAESDERFDLLDIREDQFFGLRQEWEHELPGNQYLRWGFDVRSYDVPYDYEMAAVVQDPINDPRFYPGERLNSFHDQYQGEQYSVFVTDRVRLGKRFTGELGLRYDRQTLTDDNNVSPRLNLVYDAPKVGVLRFGWGHFYQSQRPYELRVQYGETEFLPAQRAEQFTAGYETDLGSHHILRVDAYLREVSDPHPRWETIFSVFSPVPEISIDLAKIAPESASAHGVELYLARRGGGSFDWWVSYAYSSIEDRINGVDTPRFVDQPHAFTASASWRPGPKWSLTGVFAYHTGWPTTAVQAYLVAGPDGEQLLSYDVGPFYQERLSDYYRIDVRASRTSRVGKRGQLTFFIDVQNLTNRENEAGIEISDPWYHYDPETGTAVTFPTEHWLPIIPSFGVSYEF